MALKTLFILSRDVMFFHGSGEIEAKLLQVGIQLFGHKCDIAGIDSVDFYDYDVYFLFSLREDVIQLFSEIPENKQVIIIPQVDKLSERLALSIREKSARHNKTYILARSQYEYDDYCSYFHAKNIIRAEGWFLKPFIHEDLILADIEECDGNYCLSMASADRVSGLDDVATYCDMAKIEMYVMSDTPGIQEFDLVKYSNVQVKKRVPYGSGKWYRLLENCYFFYEPNARLTCSVLEVLWLGGRVVSPHAAYLNSVLGQNYIVTLEDYRDNCQKEFDKMDVKNSIYKYHANFTAGAIFAMLEGNLC